MIFDTIEHYDAPYMYVDKWLNRDYGLHFHQEIEITLILSGSAVFWVNHQHHLLQSGDMILINRVTPHSITETKACEGIWLAINPNFSSNFFPQLPTIRFKESVIDVHHPLNAELSSAIKAILEFSRTQAKGYAFKLQELLNHIAFLLISELNYIQISNMDIAAEHKHLERVLKILDYIENNYSHRPRLEELAAQMDLSSDYLSHFIKETFGLSFREVLTQFRLRQAVDMLDTCPVRQLELLLQTGFSDYRYFEKAFFSHYGCSPEEYVQNRNPGA